MTTTPTQKLPSLRARLKRAEQMAFAAIKQANDGTIVVAALADKFGLTNKEDIRCIVDAYMRKTMDKIAEVKAKQGAPSEVFSGQIIPGFIDKATLDKVIEAKPATTHAG